MSSRLSARDIRELKRKKTLLKEQKVPNLTPGELGKQALDFERGIIKKIPIDNLSYLQKRTLERYFSHQSELAQDLGYVGHAEQFRKRAQIYHTPRITPALISITGLLGALFFISVNLTGNAVSAGINGGDARVVGLLLFVCGLIFAFIHFKGKQVKFRKQFSKHL